MFNMLPKFATSFVQRIYIVKPPVSGRPRELKKWPLKRGVRLWEVKNVVFV